MSAETVSEKIKTLFFDLFRKNGLHSIDSFDYTVFFMQKTFKSNLSFKENFAELLEATPSEDCNIIQYILRKSFQTNANKHGRIYVANFIDEITKEIITLHAENKKVDSLIEKYSAYEIVNTIEQNKKNFQKYEERTLDLTKSSFKACISSIKGIPHGDYKFTLLISQAGNKKAFLDSIDAFPSEELEYKLNHVISIKQDVNEQIVFEKEEYVFPSIEFFCNDVEEETDSGTNLLSFQLKMDNLNKNFSDSIYSEKFKFLELLIGNAKALMNNFQKVKILEANLNLANAFYDVNTSLIIKVEFDPITLMSVFNTISEVLKHIISYKVRIEHKYKTIMNYFEEIEAQINGLLNPPETKNDCVIF